MAMNSYVLVVNGQVAEPPITLPSAVDPATVFARGLVFAPTTGLSPQPVVGTPATVAAGVWSFGTAAATAAAQEVAAQLAAVPDHVAAYQFKSVLSATPGSGGASLLGNANSWIGAQPEEVQLTWSQATAFLRAGALVAALQVQLGWTSAQVDGFFRAAVLVSVRA